MIGAFVLLFLVSLAMTVAAPTAHAQDRGDTSSAQRPIPCGLDATVAAPPGRSRRPSKVASADERIAAAEKSGASDLDLSGLNLSEIPPKVFDLVRLRRLNLSSNALTTLRPDIARLTELEELRLVGNQLTALPAELAALRSLKILQVSGNPLTVVSVAELGRLTSLEEL